MLDDSMDSDDDQQNNYSNLQKQLIAGKIVMLQLENFLTHSEAKVFPNELLNIVIGPNGTGKSSLVAGIIIGMGGSTKILSAQNHLSDYVKNGKERAKITVVLYRDEQRRLKRFCREFGRDNKSVYAIDDRKVTEKQYLQEINDLNIQVGNLCQFLPQERVQDFAKQNPQELFNSTLKSVCSDELITLFNKLKELRNQQLNGSKESKTIADTLRENERRVELLKVHVAEILRQDELVERKDVIGKKLAWMDFEELFVKCKEIDKDLKVATKSHTEAIKKKTDLDKSIQNVTKERQKYESILSKETTKKNKTSNELNRLREEFEKLEDTLTHAKNKFQSIERAANEHQQKLNENQMVLSTYQKEYNDYLATITSVEAVTQEMQTCDDQCNGIRDVILKLEQTRSSLNSQIDGYIRQNLVRIENRIESMNSAANAKLNFLRDAYGDTYQAVVWLRENKDRFRGRIYEPLIIEINVRSNEYCKYIENTVSVRDLIAFTCEEAEDMNLLIKILRNEMKLDVNVLHSVKSSNIRFKSKTPINEVRKFGGEIYLVDCIEAPIPIVNFLCQNYRFHDVLIGSENIDRKVDSLPAHLNLIFSPTHRIQIKKSKYSEQKSTMMNEIKSKNLLNVRISKRELNDLQIQRDKTIAERDAMYNKRNGIEAKINAMETQCKDIFKKKNEKKKLLFTLKEMENRVEQQTEKLNRVMNNDIDLATEKRKFDQNAKDIVAEMLNLEENAITIYNNQLINDLAEVKARAQLTIFKNGTMNYDVQLMELNEEIDRKQEYCNRIGALLDKTKQECKNKQIIAMQLTDNRKPSDGDNFPYKDHFDKLSNEKTVLLEEIEDLENQINGRTTGDQRTLEEYHERSERIERLKNDMQKATKSSDSLESEMKTLHNKWYPKIAGIIETINQNFGRFMVTIGCAGEVEIIKSDERDYEKYGIEIRVKYRNTEQLQPLDRFIQSGGERAVAIAVYSLSLQHLSQVPYRCVDEINQGMDPNNERRIFEMLINNVAQPGQSQFFYVTPKLQPNMPFNENTACLTVFNGAFSEGNAFFESSQVRKLSIYGTIAILQLCLFYRLKIIKRIRLLHA